ncbi:MAG: PIN domain-containing protein [Aridibacter sp.]|nr:PIN domain-containing protein [Acidobacteriota bacterium]
MRVLLDTNVVLDFVLARQPFFADADKIFISLQNKEFVAYVSAITPINTFYTTRKLINKASAFIAIEDLLKIVEIAKSNIQIYENALTIGFKDFEDAVQHESAVAENLDAIITRNEKDFKNGSMQIYSPADFLKAL